MFGMTAFVALAALAARYAIGGPERIRLLAWLAIPVLLGCAVGTLRSQMIRWIAIGVGIDLAFMLLLGIVG
jgi:hypothetical protein